MISQLTIDESMNSEQLLKMRQQTLAIQEFSEFTFFQTPFQKTSALTEKVQHFVDEWRTSLPEQELSLIEKSILYTLLGTVFNSLPTYNELSTHFLTQAIRYKQDNFFALLQLGIASTKSKNYRRAELMFDCALKFAKPDYLSTVFCHQSQLYRQVDNATRALQAARDAVEHNPNSEVALFALGMSLLKMSSFADTELTKAAHALKKCIQLRELQQKPFPDARFNYAMLAHLRYDFQTAYDQFKKAVEEDPSFNQATIKYNELEQLISACTGRVAGRQLEAAIFQDKDKGIFGLVYGRNYNHTLQFRILSKLESLVPHFYIIQSTEQKQQNMRCLFASYQSVKELEAGVVVQIKDCQFRKLQLSTKVQQYECNCICFSGSEIQINGQEVQLSDKNVVLSQVE